MNDAIKHAVKRLGTLRYFPTDPDVRLEIMALLSRMVSTPSQLDWLVVMMVDRVGEWLGPVELRGVYCTRYKPADGIEGWSTIPGFTALDSEAATSMLPPPKFPALPPGEREEMRQLTGRVEQAVRPVAQPAVGRPVLRLRITTRQGGKK